MNELIYKPRELSFRQDFIEKIKSQTQRKFKNDNIIDDFKSLRFYPKRKVNIREILNHNYNREIFLFFKKFKDYGFIIEEKKHYFYIEKIRHYKKHLKEYFSNSGFISQNLLEYFVELFKTIEEFYNKIDFSKSERGLFIPCVNSKLYKSGKLEYDETICPICLLTSVQKFIDKFTIFTDKENYGLDLELDKFETENDIKFTNKEREILTFLNEFSKLLSILQGQVYITLTNIYLPVLGFIPYIHSEDNDLMNINNYQYYILVFNSDNELLQIIKPISEYLLQKGLSLQDVSKIGVSLIIEEIENDENKIRTLRIPEPIEESIFIDYEVDEFIGIIDYSKNKGFISQNEFTYENSIFYNFFEELNYHQVQSSLINTEKHQIMLEFIRTKLASIVEKIIEELNINLDELKNL